MPSGYTSITLKDSINTAILNDFTNYSLQDNSWSPRAARRRGSTIGNRCPYEDVTEEINISVIGSSLANAVLKVTYLTDLLERAKQYNDLDNVGAVTLEVEPQGSTSGVWSALVLDGEVILPNNWADLAATGNIENVTLRIVRRGLWTRSEYTSGTSTSTANQRLSAAMSITDPGRQGYLSEVLVTPNADEGTNFHPGYIIVTNATNKVQIIAGANAFNDSANKPAATATNITSFTSTSIQIDLTTVSSPQLTSSAKRVAILGTFKSSASPTTIACTVYSDNYGHERQYFTIPSYTEEDVQYVGVFNWSTTMRYVSFESQASADTIYFDMGVLVDVSDTSTSIIKMPNMTSTTRREYRVVNGANDVSPYAEAKPSAGNYSRIASLGDLWMPFNGTNAYAMRFARGNGNLWQPCTTTPTAITNTFRVKALEASILPR